MYCDFFGFSEKPFDVTPDPRFLFLTPGHREALASLIYGIHERRGFIAIVGEVGTGKTTLLNSVLRQIEKEVELRVGVIFNTDLDFNSMLAMALVDLKIAKPGERLSKANLLHRLNEFAVRQLSRGGNVVLMVDEAQNLDASAMENLRLLSNLETYRTKLIQIVLSGQPELDIKLSKPGLRQLNQRISLKRYITPLREKETYDYIQHRLTIAGYSGPTLFDTPGQELIWEYSKGVPRKINILCDNALLIGYGLQQKTIEATMIEEAIRDLTVSLFVGTIDVPAAEAEPEATPREAPVPSAEARAPVPSAEIRLPVPVPLAASPIQVSRVTQRKITPSRVAVAASVVLAAGGIFFAGLFLGSSQLAGPVLGTSPSPGGINEPLVSEAKASKAIIVKKGDHLTGIITRTYGRFDTGLLNSVLQKNSDIQDPDVIQVGQVVKLPEKKK